MFISLAGDSEVYLSLPAPLLMATGSCLVCLSTVKRDEAVSPTASQLAVAVD